VRLTQRLLLGSLGVVGVLVLVLTIAVDRSLRARLTDEMAQRLATEAQLVAEQWRPGVDSDALANRLGRLTGHRVTLVDSSGVVRGDAEFDGDELAHLENHATRPEIVEARRSAKGMGSSRRRSASAGDEELYVAVRADRGFARVSLTTASLNAIVGQARRDVAVAGLLALAVAALLSWLFAQTVSKPVVELSGVARALAAGDFSRRPGRAAPGEVGDLAIAISQLAEQLSARLDALRAEESLVRELAESLNEGILVVDARHQVVRLNETARLMLLLRAPLPFSEDLLPRDRLLRDSISGAMRGDTARDLEATIGGRVYNITARPLEQSGGAVVTLLDLTRMRRLETVRRDFVANVSHELKTPLTVVRGFAETLADDDPPADVRRAFAESIATHTRRMQRLVDDLLDLSRIESGGWVPAPQMLDISAVIADDISAQRAVADRKQLDLDVNLGEDARQVYADPTALRQIVGNLVDNALRHTASGRITLSATREADGVTVSVADTGSGIAAEHLPRIFERFYRVDPARSREQGGTGLGLSIVKHLAEAHGGRVTARSVLGEGTTIAVWFPDPAGSVET
jgi:signal transduction histidine kinase